MTTTAIIAAYNEAPRIRGVLDVVAAYPGFAEIIVIDDGSTDGTNDIVASYPRVTYLKNEVNAGKGAAMDRAVAQAHGDILFFCDADIKGLTHQIITELLAPVQQERKEMAAAMRYHTSLRLFPWLLPFIFQLGGERAVTRRLWQQVPDYYKHQFRIEAALNFYAARHGKGFTYAYYPELRQPTKDKKRGFWLGNWQRACFLLASFSPPPPASGLLVSLFDDGFVDVRARARGALLRGVVHGHQAKARLKA